MGVHHPSSLSMVRVFEYYVAFLAYGFGFCRALILALGDSYGWSSFLGLLGGEKCSPP
jgi:hypothetical protein